MNLTKIHTENRFTEFIQQICSFFCYISMQILIRSLDLMPFCDNRNKTILKQIQRFPT